MVSFQLLSLPFSYNPDFYSLVFIFFSGGDCSLKFKKLMDNIMKSAPLAEKYNSVRSE